VDPNQVIASYQREVADITAKAEEAKEQIKNLTGTATSQDGAVTVTVSGAGALLDVSFGSEADGLPRAQLASSIMATARRAQAQASQRILDIMGSLVGEESDAMNFVREQIPSPEEPDEPEPPEELPRSSYPGQQAMDDEPATPPPPPTPAPLPRPPRAPRRPVADDDDDFAQGSPLNRTESW
jgi:DNA-binding protein YbaB